MKLYANNVAAFSRPLVLFVAGNDIDVEMVTVNVFEGECKEEAFAKLNPSMQIPLLDDDGFLLTECSAILKYLADKIDSPDYPRDLQKRARVNEAMDWFNTGFIRDFSYQMIYPQILPDHKRPSEEVNRATVEWGKEKAQIWLGILDKHWLGGGNRYLCGDEITIADYFATGPLLVGELIGVKLDNSPNGARWLENMKSLPAWETVDYAAAGFVDAMKGPEYITIG